jgi:hypothetical protein
MTTSSMPSKAHWQRFSSSDLGRAAFAFGAGALMLLPACNESSASKAALKAVAERTSTVHAAAVKPLQAPVATPGTAIEQDPTVAAVSDAFRRFHEDTGAWPNGDDAWKADTNAQVDAMEFNTNDTALFTKPASLKECSAEAAKPCWAGPYLRGASSLGDPSMHDKWGHPLLVTLMRPFDGNGGGALTAKDGAVLVWSRGPDGKDGYGCIDGGCLRDDKKVALGQPSVAAADDHAVLVGTTR